MPYLAYELHVTGRRISVKVVYEAKPRSVELEEGSTVEDLLRALHLYLDSHLVTNSNRPLPITCVLRDGEELKIIQVASGG